MGKYKTKAIQADLAIFAHIAAYSDRFRYIQQTYSGIFRTLCNPDIFRILGNSESEAYSEPEAFSEPWYIQNPGLFRTLVCSEPWYIQNQRYIQDPDIFRTQTYFASYYIQNPGAFCENNFYPNNIYYMQKKYGGPVDRGP